MSADRHDRASRRRRLFAPPAPEVPCYLEHEGAQVYAVLHRSAGRPAARVLLCGPFGLERDVAYLTWVRWARRLAREGFEVLHFDYRGIGESTGATEVLGVSDWLADVRLCLRFLEARPGAAPLLLHGLRFGGLLASRVFASGEGDGLLLWEPPSSARAALLDTLRRKLAEELVGGAARRRSRRAYIAELEERGVLEVDGYRWGRKLWQESASSGLSLPADDDPRPSLVMHLDARAERAGGDDKALVLPIPKPPFWSNDPFLLSDLEELFSMSAGFLRRAAQAGREAA